MLSSKRQLDFRIPLISGLLLFGINVVMEVVFQIDIPVWDTLMIVIACALMLWGVFLGRSQSAFHVDERFLMHRLKSTRLAATVGLVMIVGWFAYEAYAHQVYYWHLLIIGTAMAISKLVAMAYYRWTD